MPLFRVWRNGRAKLIQAKDEAEALRKLRGATRAMLVLSTREWDELPPPPKRRRR